MVPAIAMAITTSTSSKRKIFFFSSDQLQPGTEAGHIIRRELPLAGCPLQVRVREQRGGISVLEGLKLRVGRQCLSLGLLLQLA
jgi:hypothetical protein